MIYEQSFIDKRISEQNLEDFLENTFEHTEPFHNKKNTVESFNYIYNEGGVDELMRKLQKVLGKSIIELCFKIKPINKERLRKISRNQWQKFGEKYGIKITETFIKSKHESIRLDDFVERNNYDRSATLAKISLYPDLDIGDYMETTKAIHDLIWELETV